MQRLRQLYQLHYAVQSTRFKKSLSSTPKDQPKSVLSDFPPPDTFLKEIKNRREEAKNSVCIQFKNFHELSTDVVCDYISRFGQIKYLSSCDITENKKSILVEYVSSTSAKNLLETCYNQGYDGCVPLYSNFLEYRYKENKNNTNKSKSSIHFDDINCRDDIMFNNLRDAKSVSHQIQIFYDSQKLTEIEKRMRFLVCQQLETVFSGMFPQCKVFPFGSSVNGYGYQKCDLDMLWQLYPDITQVNDKVLHFKSKFLDDRRETINSLKAATSILENFVPDCGQVQKIMHARIPILKFNHSSVNIECDFSMAFSGFDMSELLYMINLGEPRVKYLFFVIRRWAADNAITSSTPGYKMTNFPLLLLVIYFFQSKGGVSFKYIVDYLENQDGTFLPIHSCRNVCEDYESIIIFEVGGKVDLISVHQSQAKIQYVLRIEISGQYYAVFKLICKFNNDFGMFLLSAESKSTEWFLDQNTTLSGDKDYVEKSIGDLLLEFFEFYSSFNFKDRGISVFHGTDVPKSDDQALYLENPIDFELNVAKAVSEAQMQEIQACMQSTLKILTTPRSSKDNSWGLCSIFTMKRPWDENKSISNTVTPTQFLDNVFACTSSLPEDLFNKKISSKRKDNFIDDSIPEKSLDSFVNNVSWNYKKHRPINRNRKS
ncbi:Poly(A) RNA polymerase, mitochondrial [Nymphon striatum]|nr:Poly(A) RNA polymerase, mitochondrial [Nymphon striatum]